MALAIPRRAAYCGVDGRMLFAVLLSLTGALAFGWLAASRHSVVAGAVLLPIAFALTFWRPEWAVYGVLLACLLPWTVAVPSTGLTLQPAVLAAPVLLGVLLARAYLNRTPITGGRFAIFGAAILLLAAISLPKTIEPKWSAVDVVVLTLTPLCLYLALLNEPRVRVQTAMHVLTVAVGIICAIAVLGLTVFPALQAVSLQADGTAGATRAASVYGNPNGLAMIINLFWPFAAVAALAAVGWRRVAWSSVTALLLVTLLLTYSRGGWVAALASLAVFAFTGARRYRGVAFAVTALLVVTVLNVPDLSSRFALGLSANDPSQYTRAELWQSALMMAAQHPLLGVGFGPYNYANYLDPRYFLDLRVASTHNVYLDFLLFTGGLGLAVYVLLLLRAVAMTFTDRAGMAGRQTMSGSAILAVLAAWIVHGFVDVTYWSLFRVVAFWTVLALLERSRAGGDQTNPTNPASEGIV